MTCRQVLIRLRLPTFVLLLGLLTVLAAQAREIEGEVLWIYDGDTIKVEDVGKVRLIGIDTPERNASERDRFLTDQGVAPATLRRISREAFRYNLAAVKGKTVTLEIGDPDRDRHGRLLAYVQLPDGRLLNKVLLEKGYAVVYRRFDFRLKEEFLQAEQEARENGRGVWGK